MSVQTTAELRNRHLASAVFEPERFAQEFDTLLQRNAPAAIALWKSTVRALPEDLRTVLGRFLISRLGQPALTQLNRQPEGSGLLFSWTIEKSRRPAMPPLPFFSPRLAWFHFADLVGQFGSVAAQDALAQGLPVVVVLRRPQEALGALGPSRHEDQLAVLNGADASPGGCHARSFALSTQPGAIGDWDGSLVLRPLPQPLGAHRAYAGQGMAEPADGPPRTASVCIHCAAPEQALDAVGPATQRHGLPARTQADFLAAIGRYTQFHGVFITTR